MRGACTILVYFEGCSLTLRWPVHLNSSHTVCCGFCCDQRVAGAGLARTRRSDWQSDALLWRLLSSVMNLPGARNPKFRSGFLGFRLSGIWGFLVFSKGLWVFRRVGSTSGSVFLVWTAPLGVWRRGAECLSNTLKMIQDRV